MKAHDDLPTWIYLSGQTKMQTACRMCSILTTSSSFSSFCASSKTESSNATIWANSISTFSFHETNVSGNRRSHGKMMSKCIQCFMYVWLQVQASACWCTLTDGPRSFLWALCCPCYKLHRMKAHDDLPTWIYLSGQTKMQTACRMCSILTTSSSFSSFCASSKTESSNATIWENRISTVIFHETGVPENRRFHFASWYAHNCTHRRAANDLPTLCCMSVRTKLRNDAPTACRLCSMLTRPSSLSSFSASS